MFTLFFYYLLPLLVVSRLLNYLRISNHALKVKYQIADLKCRLNALAVYDVRYKDDPRYQFLQYNLSKAPAVIDQLNFWVILYIGFKDRKRNKYALFDFEKNIAHDPDLRSIHNDYTRISVNFFKSKSKFSLIFFGTVLRICQAVAYVFNADNGKNFLLNFKRKLKYLLIWDGGYLPAMKLSYV